MSKKRLKILGLCALSGVLLVMALSRISRPVSIETADLPPAAPDEESSLIIGGMPLATSSASSTIALETQTSTMPSSLPSGTLLATFTPPYPFAWDEGGVHFAVTGVALGNSFIPHSPDTPAIMFTLSITSGGQTGTCVPMPLKLVADETGMLRGPVTRQFVFPESGGCVPKAHATYDREQVLFAVPNAQSYLFTTGDDSTLFFNVDIASGTIVVHPITDNAG
ncbi:MAG: hypothetical protein Q7S28_01830 [bacterium]|nr:hypothetical protein [bacterium]